MLTFCTYFDINYLPRALALYESLCRHCVEFHLHVLCLDEESYAYLSSSRHAHVTPVSAYTLESQDHELLATKQKRTRLEYFYTCGPSLLLYVLEAFQHVDLVTYLDADLFFYSDPAPLIREIEGGSIGITAHHFPEHRRADETGIYNVGWLSFRRDENGLACLHWWRERCLEWCHERFEEGKYADQMYLNEWPDRFRGVRVLQHRGANVAPWNIRDYRIWRSNGTVLVDGFPLVFFHFHGFRQINDWLYNTNLGLTLRFPSKVLRDDVFRPYIIALRKYADESRLTRSIRKKRLRNPVVQGMRTALRVLIGILFRQYVVFFGGRVY